MWDWQWNWRRFLIGVVYNKIGRRVGAREVNVFLGFAHIEYHFPQPTVKPDPWASF